MVPRKYSFISIKPTALNLLTTWIFFQESQLNNRTISNYDNLKLNILVDYVKYPIFKEKFKLHKIHIKQVAFIILDSSLLLRCLK